MVVTLEEEKMEHQKQVETVKKALELSCQIQNTKDKIVQLRQEQFRDVPAAPVKKIAEYKDPEIKPTIKFNWILALILLVTTSGIGTLAYMFAYYRPKKKQEIEQIRCSPAYQQQCAEVRAEVDRTQQMYDKEYDEEKNKYDTVVLPQYKEKKEMWEAQHREMLKKAQESCEQAEASLARLYQDTCIIPLPYQTIPALQYIYDIISTSNYDIREAIESYDKNEQRKLEMAKLNAQQEANELAYQQNELAIEQNDLLNQQNTIAAKARRDANISSVVGAVQRHNTNKILQGKK